MYTLHSQLVLHGTQIVFWVICPQKGSNYSLTQRNSLIALFWNVTIELSWQDEATGMKTVSWVHQTEAGPPAIRASVTTVTTSGPESPARWRPWSEPRSRWSKRRRTGCSSTRGRWMSLVSLRPTAPASPPRCPTRPSCPCPAWCAAARAPPASTSTTGTPSKPSTHTTTTRTRPARPRCLVSAAPAQTGSPGRASPSPKTTCRRTCPPHTQLHSPRAAHSSTRLRRGHLWTDKLPMLWLATPWSTCTTRRTCGVTRAWPAEGSSTTWRPTWGCRPSRCRDTRPPQSSSPTGADDICCRSVTGCYSEPVLCAHANTNQVLDTNSGTMMTI